MGVAGLHVWLRAHFGSCFTHHRWTTAQTESTDEWSRVEGVGVDLGGELHHLCQQSAGTHELFFFQRLHERLDAILLRLRPQHSAVLALDGPGPAAKWAEQRRRRMKGSSGNRRTERMGIDPLQLTPGTVFMEQVREALCHYACERLLTVPLLHDLRFSISPATAPGEAELKLAEIMSHELEPGDNSAVDDTDQRRHYMIVSDDSDLVLIGLCMSTLYRVDVSVLRRSSASSGPDCFERFSTAGFFDRLRRSFPHDPPGRVALDFVFLVLLTGNDYLPCLDKAKIQNLWRTYRALKGADPQDDDAGPPARAGQYLYDPSSRKIDPAFCATFLLANSSLFPYASSKPVPVDSTSDDDEEEENESVSECATKEKPPVARRGEETDASTAPRALSLPSAEMYLYGLEWNMRMYLDFRCPNYDYFYPSWDAPSPRALVERLQRLARRNVRTSESALTRLQQPSATAKAPPDHWPADPLPLLPYHFCLALMPPWGKEYLPEALQRHCEVVDDIESALFMNPGDLVDSRRMVVQGLDAHTPTATATTTTTSSSSSSQIASAFTPLEERTLSFAPHFFYERWVRQERPRSAAERTTKKRRRVATQEPEEPREVDEFGRDAKEEGRQEREEEAEAEAETGNRYGGGEGQ